MTLTWNEAHKNQQWGKYPNEQVVRWVMKNFGNVPDRSKIRFLDLGCGQGSNTLFLVQEGFSVTAVDQSKDAIEKLEDNLWDLELDKYLILETLITDFAYLGKRNVYDAALDAVSTCHNNNPEVIFNEVHKSLKPNGRLFSILPRIDTWREPFEKYGNVTYFNKDLLDEMFKNKFSYKLGTYDIMDPGDHGHVLKFLLVDATKI